MSMNEVYKEAEEQIISRVLHLDEQSYFLFLLNFFGVTNMDIISHAVHGDQVANLSGRRRVRDVHSELDSLHTLALETRVELRTTTGYRSVVLAEISKQQFIASLNMSDPTTRSRLRLCLNQVNGIRSGLDSHAGVSYATH